MRTHHEQCFGVGTNILPKPEVAEQLWLQCQLQAGRFWSLGVGLETADLEWGLGCFPGSMRTEDFKVESNEE
jgi:hypothetical protein